MMDSTTNYYEYRQEPLQELLHQDESLLQQDTLHKPLQGMPATAGRSHWRQSTGATTGDNQFHTCLVARGTKNWIVWRPGGSYQWKQVLKIVLYSWKERVNDER